MINMMISSARTLTINIQSHLRPETGITNTKNVSGSHILNLQPDHTTDMVSSF